jgi:hypothetical protein
MTLGAARGQIAPVTRSVAAEHWTPGRELLTRDLGGRSLAVMPRRAQASDRRRALLEAKAAWSEPSGRTAAESTR